MALQTAAWAGMVVSYARGETLSVAIEKTFDGAHPCTLCNVVKTGQSEEKKQQSAKSIVKLDAVLVAIVQAPHPLATEWSYPLLAMRGLVRALSPPTPPPLVA